MGRRDGRPISNAIVWQDQRTASAVEALRKTGLETEVKARSGLPLDPYFSASKLRWIELQSPLRKSWREQVTSALRHRTPISCSSSQETT